MVYLKMVMSLTFHGVLLSCFLPSVFSQEAPTSIPYDDSSLVYLYSTNLNGTRVVSVPTDPELGLLKPDAHQVIYRNKGEISVGALAADERGRLVFFRNYRHEYLRVIDLATNKTATHLHGRCEFMEGVAYDWLGQHLYWTDNLRSTVMMSDANFTNVVQIYKNESLITFRIAVHAARRRIYFSSYRPPFIAVMDMAGNNVKYLFKQPLLNHVPSIAIDYKEERLYWINYSYQSSSIMSSDLDGNNLKNVYPCQSGWFTSLAVYQDSLFVSDMWRYDDEKYRVWVISKSTGERHFYNSQQRIRGVAIVGVDKDPLRKDVLNGCQPSNPCEQVCIPLAGDEYECACAQGYELNGTECISNFYDDRFLITIDVPHKKIFQIPLDDDVVSYTALPIPTTFDGRVTVIALDTLRKLLYWFDASTVVIYKSRFNGSDYQPFLVGKHAKSMAVDPSTGNVYFVDDESGSIYVVDSNGEFPTELYSRKDNPDSLNHTEALALDLENKHVYWTAMNDGAEEDDSVTLGVVMRMGFDGSNVEVVFNNILTPRVIVVDNNRSRLFVGSNGDLIFEIPLSSLIKVSGSIPSDKVRHIGPEASTFTPIIALAIHNNTGYMLRRWRNRITKFSLDPHSSYRTFGSKDLFAQRHLILYDSEYTDHYTTPANACLELDCDQLCLQRPDGKPPACRCGDGFKASLTQDAKCEKDKDHDATENETAAMFSQIV